MCLGACLFIIVGITYFIIALQRQKKVAGKECAQKSSIIGWDWRIKTTIFFTETRTRRIEISCVALINKVSQQTVTQQVTRGLSAKLNTLLNSKMSQINQHALA